MVRFFGAGEPSPGGGVSVAAGVDSVVCSDFVSAGGGVACTSEFLGGICGRSDLVIFLGGERGGGVGSSSLSTFTSEKLGNGILCPVEGD